MLRKTGKTKNILKSEAHESRCRHCHHHHLAKTESGHLLTNSGLTCL